MPRRTAAGHSHHRCVPAAASGADRPTAGPARPVGSRRAGAGWEPAPGRVHRREHRRDTQPPTRCSCPGCLPPDCPRRSWRGAAASLVRSLQRGLPDAGMGRRGAPLPGSFTVATGMVPSTCFTSPRLCSQCVPRRSVSADSGASGSARRVPGRQRAEYVRSRDEEPLGGLLAARRTGQLIGEADCRACSLSSWGAWADQLRGGTPCPARLGAGHQTLACACQARLVARQEDVGKP